MFCYVGDQKQYKTKTIYSFGLSGEVIRCSVLSDLCVSSFHCINMYVQVVACPKDPLPGGLGWMSAALPRRPRVLAGGIGRSLHLVYWPSARGRFHLCTVF